MIQHRSRATTLASLLVLLVLAVLSVLAVLPPTPVAADAPADEFSAERAFEHVEVIGAEVHPHGTPAADRVREYIVDELDAMGLDPEVTEATGLTGRLGGRAQAAGVQNVVATVEGTDSTGPIFLMAHYDSAEVSHGANDDGAGVSTLLESARAILAADAPRNDLVLVFTDAEESCLCGAEAFADSDPRAADGGIVLNFEARGSSGPAVMFETSPGNADLVAQYATVPYPVGSSLAVEVYRILPNDTDFSPFLDAGGFTGLNAAYIDGSAAYHAPQDQPETMNLASLQHHGSNTLALARALGDADAAALATPSAHDSTYFPLPGGVLAQYPGWLVWPLAVLALVAVGALGFTTARRTETGPGRLALGFGAALLPIVLTAVGAQLFWMLLVAIRPGYGEMLDPWHPWGFRIALLGLVAVIVTGWFVLLRRRLGAPALTFGALGWLAVLGVVLAAFTPGGSYLAALPALAGAVAGVVALLLTDSRGRTAAVAVGAAVAIVVLVPVVVLFFPALGLATGAAPALFAALLGLALVPVLADALPLARRAGGVLVGACGTVAVVALGAGFALDGFTAEKPEPTQLMYAMDADTGEAMWVSGEGSPSPWTSQFVDEQTEISEDFPAVHGEVWTGPAEAADLPAPTAEIVADETSGDERTLTLTVFPERTVRYVEAVAENVTAATIEGREVAVADGHLDISYAAPGDEGFELVVTVPAGEAFDVRLLGGGEGLESLPGFEPRPETVGVKGSHTSELVLVATSQTF
ncbi:Peptidase family M28 [Paraoerskovia marina]|uniref:Vacuolar membrane protease n=1 Tax=Paraoerskovia marina TaxID=545619 RepID=A0A1H1MTC8_9CELL|nr:M28 family peptidase [Paraoerskovia marina]SDR89862.1 Peptidase family M28 [Paraoerskovia marina]